MSPDLSPETGRWSALVAAVDECAGERERALLSVGMWVDPVPVDCPDCGGPLVRVARRDMCTDSGEVTETLQEGYYRIGSPLGACALYRTHTAALCRWERIGRNARKPSP